MIEQDVPCFFRPAEAGPAPDDVEFVSIAEFLTDEAACKMLWELIDTQFHTRSKFLAIWRCVSYLCVHRDSDGVLDGFLLISAPVNWQIDYVVVRPDSRGQGIASKLVHAANANAGRMSVPYVMLTCKTSLRPLYESCGFRAVQTAEVLV
jgi:GNAT superfamily N-acetyltransferase